MYKIFGKRLFDFISSFMALVFLMPLFLLIAMLIKIDSRGSVFYIQKRVGKNFKEFNLYKFRSMVADTSKNEPSVTSYGDKRITKIGKFIRKYKIDELPQLLNVLKGDMSLVGPRPEIIKFVKEKKEEYKKILSIKPGITDNAAIKFRNEELIMAKYNDKELSYIKFVLPEKIKIYIDYVDNIYFITDLQIILKTLKII